MLLHRKHLLFAAAAFLLGFAGGALVSWSRTAPLPITSPTAAIDPQKINGKVATDQFHAYYYANSINTWHTTSWFGVPTWKVPLDMWIYQEMFHELRPDVLIECGTWKGGSALFFAHMFDLLNHGRVVTIDIQPQPNLPQHARISYLTGSSTDPAIVQKVRQQIKPGEKVMVVLDSDHSKKHVLEELRQYNSMVTPGSYLVVEDTNVNGHPILPDFGPGPMEALDEFLKDNPNFTIDPHRERFGLTFNPRGYLKKAR